MAPLSRVDLVFEPTFDIEVLGSAAGEVSTQFRSTGDDPQFRVDALPSLQALRPGWWRLRGTFAATDGALIAPRFYADYGRGYNEPDCLPVCGRSTSGAVDSVIFIKAPLRSLRFDPTVRPTAFRLESMRLTPLSRPRAVLMMLQGIAGARFGGRSAARRAIRRLLRDAARANPSIAAAALLEHYVQSQALPEGGYALWHELHDPLREESEARAGEALRSMDPPPRIDLLVHGTRPSVASLRRCLDSVLAQTWPHWRVHLDLVAPDDAARRLAAAYAARDSRILVRTRTAGPVGLGEAMTDVRASHCGVLEPDGELSRDALCDFACAVAEHPDAALFYCDSDRIDARGHRVDPCFKPDWNPGLLLTGDYVGHLSVLSAELLRELGDVRLDTPGWHHALALRCADRLAGDAVRHVPRVLYHAHGPASSDTGAPADHEAVVGLLERRGVDADVAPIDGGLLRIARRLPTPSPFVTIIVPTRDRLALLRTCIESVLARTQYAPYEILVVDNGSVEPETLAYMEALRGRPNCRVLPYPGPFNFSAIINAAAADARGDMLCLLNNDIEVITPDWLAEMVGQASMPGAGAVGAMLYYPDDTIQHGGVVLGIGGVAGHVHHRSPRGIPGPLGRARVAQELSAVTGACLVVRRAVFEEVGGFDERLAVAFNDIDFCLRVLQAGYRNVWTPHAELYHHESASRGHEDTVEKRARFAAEVETMRRRWGAFLDNDPAYNPNLTLDGSNFEPAFPPRVRPGVACRPRVAPSRVGD